MFLMLLKIVTFITFLTVLQCDDIVPKIVKRAEMSFLQNVIVFKNCDFNDILNNINDIEQLCHKPDSLLVT